MMSLGACQSTPKEAVVVDKSEGFPQEKIIEVDNENSKELGIPEYWEETLERSDGFVTIEADYEIDLPEIYNTPVYQYEPKPLSQERLKELCEYFAENNRLYEVPAMTKDELNEFIRNWSERSNRLKNYLEPLEEAMWTEEASEFKREDAIQIAEKLLEDLDIQDMEFSSV